MASPTSPPSKKRRLGEELSNGDFQSSLPSPFSPSSHLDEELEDFPENEDYEEDLYEEGEGGEVEEGEGEGEGTGQGGGSGLRMPSRSRGGTPRPEQHNEAFHSWQSSLENLNKKEEEEKRRVTDAYLAKRQKLYENRVALTKSIPSFWFEAWMNHEFLRSYLNKQDQNIFEHFTNLNVEESIDSLTFTFTFSANQWFTNSTLWKTITSSEITFSKINWRDGKDPTKQPVVVDGSEEEEDEEADGLSFFAFFSRETSDVDELIRDELWPDALLYYSGGTVSSDEEDDEEDEEEDDDDEEEEAQEDDIFPGILQGETGYVDIDEDDAGDEDEMGEDDDEDDADEDEDDDEDRE